MSVVYDQYYRIPNLFGEAYPELLDHFKTRPKGRILDLGCGQGRDAIALARLGHSVHGIDLSEIGIEQMKQIAQLESLNLSGAIEDLYTFNSFDQFDYILLDSMFHFGKNRVAKEKSLLKI